nr:sororin isoform X1 [Dasypus novemcinctus]
MSGRQTRSGGAVRRSEPKDPSPTKVLRRSQRKSGSDLPSTLPEIWSKAPHAVPARKPIVLKKIVAHVLEVRAKKGLAGWGAKTQSGLCHQLVLSPQVPAVQSPRRSPRIAFFLEKENNPPSKEPTKEDLFQTSSVPVTPATTPVLYPLAVEYNSKEGHPDARDLEMSKKVRRSYSRLEARGSPSAAASTSTPGRRSCFGFEGLLGAEDLAGVSPVVCSKSAEIPRVPAKPWTPDRTLPGISPVTVKEKRKKKKVPEILASVSRPRALSKPVAELVAQPVEEQKPSARQVSRDRDVEVMGSTGASGRGLGNASSPGRVNANSQQFTPALSAVSSCWEAGPASGLRFWKGGRRAVPGLGGPLDNAQSRASHGVGGRGRLAASSHFSPLGTSSAKAASSGAEAGPARTTHRDLPVHAPERAGARGARRPWRVSPREGVRGPGEGVFPPRTFRPGSRLCRAEAPARLQEPSVPASLPAMPRDSETPECPFLDKDDWGPRRTSQEIRRLMMECMRLWESLNITRIDNLALGEKLQNLPNLLYKSLKQEEVKATQEGTQAVQEAVKAIQEAVNVNQGEAQAVQKKVKANQEAVKANQGEAQAVQKEVKANQEAVKANQAEAQAVQKKVKADQEAVKANQEAVKANQAEAQAVQKKVKANQEAVKANQAEAQAVQKKVKANQETVKANQEAVKANQAEAQAVQKKVKANQEAVKANQGEAQAVQKEVKANQGAVKANQAKAQSVQEKVKANQEAVKTNQGEAQAVQKEVKADQEAVKAIQEGTQTIQGDAQAVQEEAKIIREEVKAIQEGAQAIQEEVKAIQGEAQVTQKAVLFQVHGQQHSDFGEGERGCSVLLTPSPHAPQQPCSQKAALLILLPDPPHNRRNQCPPWPGRSLETRQLLGTPHHQLLSKSQQ